MNTKEKIGFIGQGFIGKNYADDFERRGFEVIRYALEEPYRANKEKIRECDIVFIAVPTPTTPEGFSAQMIEDVLALVGQGEIAVIKSTVLPGTTIALQKKYPDLVVLNSPEFLSEATAAHDAAHPFSNIIGLPVDDVIHRVAAERVHAVLPHAEFTLTCMSNESELYKYSHNLSGYMQVMLFNIMYDTAQALGCDWQKVQDAAQADPMISNRYAKPLHKSGRGAGGHCFIKDMAAFREFYQQTCPHDAFGSALLAIAEQKNIALLRASGKDLDLLHGVYGDEMI